MCKLLGRQALECYAGRKLTKAQVEEVSARTQRVLCAAAVVTRAHCPMRPAHAATLLCPATARDVPQEYAKNKSEGEKLGRWRGGVFMEEVA